MPNNKRGNNMNNSFGNYGGGKKQNNMNSNRNRSSFGGKSNNNSFGGGGLGHQVSPWLSQTNNSPMNAFGRSIASDQEAQLALASTLLNNLLKPASHQLNKPAASLPSLLSLNRSVPNSSQSYGGSPGSYVNRDRFGFGRQNATGPGKVQKDYRKGDFKNKRFADRKNKKPYQPNKQANAEKKAAEKKDVVKEDNKVNTTNLDVDMSTSEKNATATTETSTAATKSPTKEFKKDGENKKTKNEEPKANYSGIPSALLFCHICRKHMWDDTSFEKHLEGKPHKMMVQELDVSYGLKVDLLRHEMRVAEQQRENDIQRAQRKGKNSLKSQQRDFCAMCNLSFLGMLSAHRKNERHQRLKKFLHPKCNVCSKEFYTRLEWDDHKLTPGHLKKLAEIRKETRPDLEDAEFDIIDFIEDIDDEFDMENIELKVVGKRDTLEDVKPETGEATATNGDANEKEETPEEKAEDEEFKKLPKYTPGVPVGENFIVDKTGSLCRACNKFCLTNEDAKTHCQSVAHYNNIVKILKAQNKIVRKRRLNDTKTEDDGAETTEGNQSKKLKTADEEPASVEMNGDAVKDEPRSEEKSGEDVYDPEDPGSENEKDAAEVVDVTKSDVAEEDAAAITTEDVSAVAPKDEPKVEVPDVTNEVQSKQVSPAKKQPTRGQQTAIRGQRARRGRRH